MKAKSIDVRAQELRTFLVGVAAFVTLVNFDSFSHEYHISPDKIKPTFKEQINSELDAFGHSGIGAPSIPFFQTIGLPGEYAGYVARRFKHQ